MNVVVIIMHLVNGSVVEASVSATVPKLLCTEAVKQIAVLSTEDSTMTYKGNRVFLYYCKDKKGNKVR
tara:strand:- start:184 stop:387 length:204 start_codon:yes stop_codon:yes gene_type:complete